MTVWLAAAAGACGEGERAQGLQNEQLVREHQNIPSCVAPAMLKLSFPRYAVMHRLRLYRLYRLSICGSSMGWQGSL